MSLFVAQSLHNHGIAVFLMIVATYCCDFMIVATSLLKLGRTPLGTIFRPHRFQAQPFSSVLSLDLALIFAAASAFLRVGPVRNIYTHM